MADKFGKQNIPLNAYEETKLLSDDIRSRFLKYLRKEGSYSYCKLAEEILRRNDKNIEHIYGLAAGEVRGIINSVFELEYSFQDTIESFLAKAKQIPAYTLVKPEKKS